MSTCCKDCIYWISDQDLYEDPQMEWEGGYCYRKVEGRGAFEDECKHYEEL